MVSAKDQPAKSIRRTIRSRLCFKPEYYWSDDSWSMGRIPQNESRLDFPDPFAYKSEVGGRIGQWPGDTLI